MSQDTGTNTLSSLGEFGLVGKILSTIRESSVSIPGIEVEAGDDAAVINLANASLVISVDMYVEGKHFRTDWSTAIEIGRRCAAASLSDVCAMGAVPVGALLAIGMPGSTASHWASEFISGFTEEVGLAGAVVLGGDVSESEQIVISVSALGTLESGSAVTRAGAQIGDLVGICGRSGMAAAGLRVLQRGLRSPRVLVDAFRVPKIDYLAGSRAAKHSATSMIDISDGLVADLQHIARDSQVCVELDTSGFDVPQELVSAAAAFGTDPMSWILAGGDDHALVATFPASVGVAQGFTTIGKITQGKENGVTKEGTVLINGEPYTESPGFRHFT